MDKEKYEYLKQIVDDYVNVKVENEGLKVFISSLKEDLKYIIKRDTWGNCSQVKDMLEEKYGMEFDKE